MSCTGICVYCFCCLSILLHDGTQTNLTDCLVICLVELFLFKNKNIVCGQNAFDGSCYSNVNIMKIIVENNENYKQAQMRRSRCITVMRV